MRFVNHVGRVGTCIWALLAMAAPVRAQDYVQRANALYDDISQDLRSDLVILPVLAQMAEPPRGVETMTKAALQLASESPIWREAESWAQEPAQQAALQILDEITSETNYRTAMAFGLPYGVETLAQKPGGIDIISANLHVDLDVGGTPLLAGADFRYLSGVENLICLVQVEATRLAAAGDVGAALEVLADGVFFGRQIADRGFAEEMTRGLEIMMLCLERMRDVVYLDLRGPEELNDAQGTLEAIIDRLGERTREGGAGYIGVERLRFPVANRLAADQLAEHVLDAGGVNRDTFVRTMSYLTARGNPMMLFSQTPRWRETSEFLEVGRQVVMANIQRIHDDYSGRWNRRDPHDPQMGQQAHYELLVARGDPALPVYQLSMGPLEGMLDLWQQVRLEAIGTRHALALAAYEYANNQHAPSETAVRPRWLAQIEPDPLNSQYLRSNPSLQYIIPGRQIRQNQHTINIVLGEYANFQKTFTGDEFLLYSVGADSQNNVAVEIQNTPEFVPGADYLIWPPVLSLMRENLMTLGQLR